VHRPPPRQQHQCQTHSRSLSRRHPPHRRSQAPHITHRDVEAPRFLQSPTQRDRSKSLSVDRPPASPCTLWFERKDKWTHEKLPAHVPRAFNL
jgi:hypothetical protein